MNWHLQITVLWVVLLSIACKKKETPEEPDIPPPPTADTIALKNDGYTDSGAVFLAGFQAGEEGAATLGPVAEDGQLIAVQFFYGGSGNPDVRDVTVHVYTDTGGVDPGPVLYSSPRTLTASDDKMQEVDVSDGHIELTTGDMIRVSIEMTDSGYPSLARDSDGDYDNTRNWIKDINGFWSGSFAVGITDDWIIRALVEIDL